MSDRASDSTKDVMAAFKMMAPWKRNMLWVGGFIAFMTPILLEIAGVVRGGHEHTLVDVGWKAGLMAAGFLGMVPQLGIWIINRALSWKKK